LGCLRGETQALDEYRPSAGRVLKGLAPADRDEDVCRSNLGRKLRPAFNKPL
jgi:hypothetical protein